MLHQVKAMLESGDLPPSGKAFWIPSASKHLVQWGAGAPSGTATAMFYINTAGTTTSTVLYGNVNGTWTVLTVS